MRANSYKNWSEKTLDLWSDAQQNDQSTLSIGKGRQIFHEHAITKMFLILLNTFLLAGDVRLKCQL
jgi:hypothetical protein